MSETPPPLRILNQAGTFAHIPVVLELIKLPTLTAINAASYLYMLRRTV